ncbi:hypothetical protein [Novosphingobium sp.]|uniref:hypothetical protein n=1 Tax=Novosphingobium sp. TaxID=1874826 RepID=UPI00286D7C17|nr:hypothetical protein [Novosphingobium sp.]
MAGVTAEIALGITATITGTNDLGSPKMRIEPISILTQFTEGTAAVGQANVLFSDTRTIAASATENIDLAGALTDAFGTTITAAEVVAIYVKADAANTNNVVVGNASSNGFVGPMGATGVYAVKPGEYFLATSQSGWAVTAATGDLLKIANSGGTTGITYDIIVIGRTVAA